MLSILNFIFKENQYFFTDKIFSHVMFSLETISINGLDLFSELLYEYMSWFNSSQQLEP